MASSFTVEFRFSAKWIGKSHLAGTAGRTLQENPIQYKVAIRADALADAAVRKSIATMLEVAFRTSKPVSPLLRGASFAGPVSVRWVGDAVRVTACIQSGIDMVALKSHAQQAVELVQDSIQRSIQQQNKKK